MDASTDRSPVPSNEPEQQPSLELQEAKIKFEYGTLLRRLKDAGASFEVIEGVGFEFLIRETTASGKVVQIEDIPQASPQTEEEAEVQKLLGPQCLVTVFDREKTERFGMPKSVALQIDQEVEISGLKLVFINGAADFVDGFNLERWQNRVAELRELLSGDMPATALTVKRDGAVVFTNHMAIEERQGIARMSAANGRDWWSEVLTGFDGEAAESERAPA